MLPIDVVLANIFSWLDVCCLNTPSFNVDASFISGLAMLLPLPCDMLLDTDALRDLDASLAVSSLFINDFILLDEHRSLLARDLTPADDG